MRSKVCVITASGKRVCGTRTTKASGAAAKKGAKQPRTRDAVYPKGYGTLCNVAATFVPALEMNEVRSRDCKSLDRLVLVLEQIGAGSRYVLRPKILRALAEHIVASGLDARYAILYLVGLDRRIAVWAACVCARQALVFVPKGEMRPLRAIETTEAWLAGLATAADVMAARLATEGMQSGTTSLDYAAHAAAAAARIQPGSGDVAYAADATAYAFSRASGTMADYKTTYAAAVQALVTSIVGALPGMPHGPFAE